MDQTGCSTPKQKVDKMDFATLPRETDAAEFSTPMRKQARASLQDSAFQVLSDDGAEKHSRQQELMQELHSLHTELPGNRSVGLVPPTFTDVELAEHCTNCIRLANENKINVKNSFNLHLIDNIGKVLQAEDGSTNLQAASCTLNASAKIYACRVDHMHSEALEIARQLGISLRLRKRELIKERVKKDDPDQPAATTKGRGKRTKSSNDKLLSQLSPHTRKTCEKLVAGMSQKQQESFRKDIMKAIKRGMLPNFRKAPTFFYRIQNCLMHSSLVDLTHTDLKLRHKN